MKRKQMLARYGYDYYGEEDDDFGFRKDPEEMHYYVNLICPVCDADHNTNVVGNIPTDRLVLCYTCWWIREKGSALAVEDRHENTEKVEDSKTSAPRAVSSSSSRNYDYDYWGDFDDEDYALYSGWVGL